MTRKRTKHSQAQATGRTSRFPHLKIIGDPTAIVSGRWLLGAFFTMLVVSAACIYLVMCLFFYVGQWQLVFQPPKVSQNTAAPTNAGMAIEDIRFDYNELGKAQLDGWWVPADAGARYGNAVVLVCHSGNTSLTENLLLLKDLHTLGINVFAFDYRNFGQSASMRPSEQSAYADGIAAIRYLTGIRQIHPPRIVVYGDGIGAAVAVHIAQQSPSVPGNIAGIVLENAKPSLLPELETEPRFQLLPLRLLFHNRFDILAALKTLQTPKLFFVLNGGHAAKTVIALYHQSAQPKQLAQLPDAGGADAMKAVKNFLQQVLS